MATTGAGITIPIGDELSEELKPGRWWWTAKFWKKLSVTASIALSIASLIISAVASLRPDGHLRGLQVSGIIVNSASICIAALTSLDWNFQSTHDREFARQLLKAAEMQEGQIVITRKGLESLVSGNRRKTM